MTATRIILGFLLAPLATVVVQFLREGMGPSLGLVLMYAYIFGLPLGIPAFIALWKLKWLQLWQVILFSVVLGLIVAVLAAPTHITLANPYLVKELGFYVLHSTAVGFLFWLVALCRCHV